MGLSSNRLQMPQAPQVPVNPATHMDPQSAYASILARAMMDRDAPGRLRFGPFGGR